MANRLKWPAWSAPLTASYSLTMEKSNDFQTPLNTTTSKKKWIIIGCIVMICLSVAGICFFTYGRSTKTGGSKGTSDDKFVQQGPFQMAISEDSANLPQYIHVLYHLYSQLDLPLSAEAGDGALRKALKSLTKTQKADLTTILKPGVFNAVAAEMIHYIQMSGIRVGGNDLDSKINAPIGDRKPEFAVIYNSKEKVTMTEALDRYKGLKHVQPVAMIVAGANSGGNKLELDLYLRRTNDQHWTLFHPNDSQAKTGIKTEELLDTEALAILYKIPIKKN